MKLDGIIKCTTSGTSFKSLCICVSLAEAFFEEIFWAQIRCMFCWSVGYARVAGDKPSTGAGTRLSHRGQTVLPLACLAGLCL
jgi:hypothetical protein